jgi:hypothetical protein
MTVEEWTEKYDEITRADVLFAMLGHARQSMAARDASAELGLGAMTREVDDVIHAMTDAAVLLGWVCPTDGEQG